MADDVGVVIPAYRPDLDTLQEYVRELAAVLEPATIRVELDAPEGRHGDLEPLYAAGATVNVESKRRGKGAAITAGFEQLETDRLAFVDADGSTPVGSLSRVIDALDRVPIAIGSRRHPDATIATHQSIVRRRFGDVFASIARSTLGLKLYDFQCGAKALRAAAWRRIREHLYESGFAWDIEVLAVAKACGIAIAEVPITWHDDPESTVDPVRTSLDMLRALLVVRHRTKALDGNRLHRIAERHATGGEPLIARVAERE
ncbi:MAG: glycosyltransferase [Halobacteriaceae archaeon]